MTQKQLSHPDGRCALQLITTNLMFLASMVVYNVNPLISLPVYALFLLIDGAYLSANLFKFLNGETPFSICFCFPLNVHLAH